MPRLLDGYHIYTGVNWRPVYYYMIEIEDGDILFDICSLMKMNKEELEEAYDKPVNEQPNGVKTDSKGSHDIKPGKIFYVKVQKCLDKRLNIRQIFNPATSIRCMYGPDEPMKNRYILFWQSNKKNSEKSDDFMSNRSGLDFGRNSGTKPIGLGVTDGDGILNGESIKWISDGTDKNIIFNNNGKFPDHTTDKDINFKCILELSMRTQKSFEIYETKEKLVTIGSKLVHNIKGNIPLHDIRKGNFIWQKNVSKFNNIRKYSFMPLPVDIFKRKTFETINLFEIDSQTQPDQHFICTKIPKTIDKSKKLNREFYVLNKDAIDKELQIENNGPLYKLNAHYKEIRDFLHFQPLQGRAKKKLIGPNYIEYKKQKKDFKYLPDLDKTKGVGYFYKQVTERNPVIKEVVIGRLTLPEWIARIKQGIRTTELYASKYRKITKQYTDVISTLGAVEGMSNVAAQFPNRGLKNNQIVTPIIFAEKSNEIQNLLAKKLKNLEDPKYKKSLDDYIKQAEKLFDMVNDPCFSKEIIDYLKLDDLTWAKRDKNRNHIFKNLTHEEKYYRNILNQLSDVLIESYTLFKNTDAFNLEVGKKDVRTIASKAFKQYYDIIINFSPDTINKLELKFPLAIILDQIQKKSELSYAARTKDFVGKYLMNAPGTPSLLVCLVDVFGPYLAEKYFNNQDKIKTGLKKCFEFTFKWALKEESFKDVKIAIDQNDPVKVKGSASEKFLSIDKYGKPGIILGHTFKSLMFGLNLWIMFENVGNDKKTVEKRFVKFVSDGLNLSLSGVGLLMKETTNSILLNKIGMKSYVNKAGITISQKAIMVKTLGIIGSLVNIYIAHEEWGEAYETKQTKKIRIKGVDFYFAVIGLMFFILIGGIGPSLVFFIAEFIVRAIILEVFQGGPMERKITAICEELESNEDFSVIKKDENILDQFNLMMNILNNYSRSNSSLSWRAVFPLINIGYVIRDKKNKINYGATEKIIDDIVNESNAPSARFTFSISELLILHKELMEKIEKMKIRDKM
ncbi:MAG: hypothetical protein GY760_21720 [Deltaproteobacteria bacterium]|nr:hypothetical protein [Deltaproteobacteria bacterium]